MRFNSEKQIIIDDKFICDFMYENGSEDFFNVCENVLRTICISCKSNLKKEDNISEDIKNRLDIFKGEFIDSINQKNIDFTEVLNCIKDFRMNQSKELLELRNKTENNDIIETIKNLNEVNKAKLENLTKKINNQEIIDFLKNSNKIYDLKLEKIPKAIDTLANKIDTGTIIENSFKKRDDKIESNISVVQNSINQIISKIDQQNISKNTNKSKGEEGEKGLIDVLEDVLPLREGYEVVETKSIPHNCDINIKKIGFPDIRIESKAHGKTTGEQVRTKEVKRFEEDIINLKTHGIFVSLYSGIVGKGNVEIDLLHTNKFVIYLSNNNYDGKIIKDYVNLLYKLDNIVSDSDENFKITSESMEVIKKHINSLNDKISTLKQNMKSSISILNEMSLNVIEDILCGNIEQNKKNTKTSEFICEFCDKTLKTKAALTSHLKICKQKPAKSEN